MKESNKSDEVYIEHSYIDVVSKTDSSENYDRVYLFKDGTLGVEDGDWRQGGIICSTDWHPQMGTYLAELLRQLNFKKQEDPEYFERIYKMCQNHIDVIDKFTLNVVEVVKRNTLYDTRSVQLQKLVGIETNWQIFSRGLFITLLKKLVMSKNVENIIQGYRETSKTFYISVEFVTEFSNEKPLFITTVGYSLEDAICYLFIELINKNLLDKETIKNEIENDRR